MKQRESAIRDELLRIAREHGGELKPEMVVEEARPETSPLHKSFDWDDGEAAENWRIHQARQLIRVTVTYEQVDREKAIPVRVFVSLTPDRQKDGPGYRVTTDVMSDVERRAQLLADAKDEMNRFRVKYRMLSELAEVFAAMDRVVEAEELTTEAESVTAAPV